MRKKNHETLIFVTKLAHFIYIVLNYLFLINNELMGICMKRNLCCRGRNNRQGDVKDLLFPWYPGESKNSKLIREEYLVGLKFNDVIYFHRQTRRKARNDYWTVESINSGLVPLQAPGGETCLWI